MSKREYLPEPDEHEYGMCRNRQGGLGCYECEDEDLDDAYDDSDLEGIERVTYISAE